MKNTIVAAAILSLGACTSTEEKAEYRDAQVKVISTQVDARAKENSADAAARIALYSAMAEVAKNSPESADAIAVALAVSSVREESDSDAPITQLHREQNEAVELTRAIAPALIGAVSTVAVAGYQASVSKNNSDNAAIVALGDSAADADIMRSVTNMASTGLARATTSIGGDYYQAGGDIDQSVSTSTATSTSTSTQTNTTTTSEQNDMALTDSNNVYTTTDGTLVNMADLEALIASGIEVTVIIDGEEVPVESCEDGLTFGGSCG